MTKALVDAGFDVTGMDTSAEMLELARANVPAARFVHASAYDAEIRNCEAVVAVGEPLTYHADEADTDGLVRTFFQRVADTLPPGGLLIFDVIGLGEPSLAGRTWSSGEDRAALVEITENQTARTLVRNLEVFFIAWVTLTGPAKKSTKSAFLTCRYCAISPLPSDSQSKRPAFTALSGFPLAVTLSLARGSRCKNAIDALPR